MAPADVKHRSSQYITQKKEPTSIKTKSLKRPRILSLEITEERPAKKNCRLQCGNISVPKNDKHTYWKEERSHLFYTFTPLDNTNLHKAEDRGWMDQVSYGMCGNRVVEALVLDRETGIPWQVPKVTVEFQRVRYISNEQTDTLHPTTAEGLPVSPTTIPTVTQMSRDEYQSAVEHGDPRVVRGDQFVFDFCTEVSVGWLPYEERKFSLKVLR